MDELKYGPVLITKGSYRGRVGFYDDDFNVETAEVWLTNHMAGVVTIDCRFLVPLEGAAAKWVRSEMSLQRKLNKDKR